MYPYMALALTSGCLLPIQLATFSILTKHFAPAGAMVISTGVSFISSIVLYLILKPPFPETSAIQSIPAWVWFGGVISALYVFSSSISGPKLGAAGFFTLLLLGQYSVSLLVDHYGVFSFQAHPINLWRVLGVVFLLSGVVMIVKN